MPQGVHKGQRVVLTVDREEYAAWKELSEKTEKPVATIMREVLSLTLPSMTEVIDVMDNYKDDPEAFDEMMGRLLWKLLKVRAE